MKNIFLILMILFFSKSYSQIKLVSWNTHMIPTAINKNSRAVEINKILIASNADVIVLQEAFGKRVRKKLSLAYKYSIQPKGKFLKVNSGLLVLSNKELTNIEYLSYSNYAGIDGLSNKGAVKFKYDSITIVNTHLQNNNRLINLKQVYQLYLFSNNTDIIAGDFNYTNSSHLCKLFDKDTYITDNTYQDSVIDYVLTNR